MWRALPKRVARAGIPVVFWLISLASWATAQTPSSDPRVEPRPTSAKEVLSWLPADTETVIVANKRFALPGPIDFHKRPELLTQEMAFISMALTPLSLKNGALAEHFRDRQVSLVLEGSRHFRAPKGLGMMPFEGCTIVALAHDAEETWELYVKEASPSTLRIEQIDGQSVLVFQEKLESGVWTSFVAFTKPNLLLVATDLDYLQEVLSRMRGRAGPRALPESLHQWRYVDTNSQFWGVRHYNKTQMDHDPSSPFGGTKAANWPDEQAIGFIFNFDPTSGKAPSITYLSGNARSAGKTRKSPLSIPMPSGDPKFVLKVTYQELSPTVVQASYEPVSLEGMRWFSFVLSAMLGHGVYL